jgi:hypothetical protein
VGRGLALLLQQGGLTRQRGLERLAEGDIEAVGLFMRTLFAWQRRAARKDGYARVLPGPSASCSTSARP